MRRLLRAGAVFTVLLASMVAASLLALLSHVLPRSLYRGLQAWLMRHWCRIVARVFGLRIEVHGKPCTPPALLACNHTSWLDIIVLGAAVRGAFVSKSEIAGWPLIGFFARSGGRTLFINRGELRSFQHLGGELIERLRGDERVIFFPEGTVSTPSALLRFKPRLFAAALAAQCAVQPVSLAYTGGDGAALAPLGQDESFGEHFVRFFGTRRTEVVVNFLAPIEPVAKDARALASAAYEQISDDIMKLSHKL